MRIEQTYQVIVRITMPTVFLSPHSSFHFSLFYMLPGYLLFSLGREIAGNIFVVEKRKETETHRLISSYTLFSPPRVLFPFYYGIAFPISSLNELHKATRDNPGSETEKKSPLYFSFCPSDQVFVHLSVHHTNEQNKTTNIAASQRSWPEDGKREGIRPVWR